MFRTHMVKQSHGLGNFMQISRRFQYIGTNHVTTYTSDEILASEHLTQQQQQGSV